MHVLHTLLLLLDDILPGCNSCRILFSKLIVSYRCQLLRSVSGRRAVIKVTPVHRDVVVRSVYVLYTCIIIILYRYHGRGRCLCVIHGRVTSRRGV